jgi:hypothetical protein
MKKVFGIAIVCCVFALIAAPVSATEVLVKVGGGVYLGDETLFGPVAAVDIPTPALEERLYVQPFVDAYISKSWFKVAGGGVNLIYKYEAEEGITVYGGAGGGVGHVRFRGNNGTGGMINVLAGAQYAATDQISVFGQAKYMAVLKDLDYRIALPAPLGTVTRSLDGPKDFAIQVGVAFTVGQ